MKNIVLVVLLLITSLSFSAERVALSTSHNKEEIVNKDEFAVYYNKFHDCTLVLKSINPIGFDNIFVDERDKVYWLLTESLYSLLEKHTIQGSTDICLVIWNNQAFYENSLLKISSENLKKHNNRNFNDEDFNSHHFIPVRETLKDAKIVNFNFEKQIMIQNHSQTNEYKDFISDYSFSRKHERKVEINYKNYIASKEGIFSDVINGNYDGVRKYVGYNFDVNRKDDENKQTLIQYAAVNGNYNIVKLLLDSGADPNAHEPNVENAYLAAKRMGYTKIVELLEPVTIIKTLYTPESNLNDRCAILIGKFGAWSACMKKESNVFSMGEQGLNAYYAIRRECHYLAGSDDTGLSYLCKNESKNGCIGLKAPQSTIDACYQCNGSNLWLRVYAMGTVLQCY